ncbi:MAG TPA: glycoside hydrolase family 31 protein [Alphaproteobacteria bacterium]|nr:glycoside hydrolase family 31 protein [Alphaproteobacteria bacterium]
MQIDFRTLAAPATLSAPEPVPGGARFQTDLGPLTVTAYAEGVLRVTLGEPKGGEYGILANPAAPPEGARLAEAEGGYELTAGAVTLRLEADPVRFTVSRGGRAVVRPATDAHFVKRYRLPQLARAEKGWFAAFDLWSGERIYGLGEKWGPLDKRGQMIVSYNEDALGVNAEISYKNTPFAWSPEGWGVFVHTPARVTHAVGHPQWSQRSYALVVEDHALDLFVIAADSPAAIIERYTHLTGRGPVPPLWSLGVWMSRAYYRTEEEFLAVAREIRERKIPCDVITLDGRAWLKVDTRFLFEWDAERYPDPERVIAELRRLDFRLCNWEYPYVSEQNPAFAELEAKGYFLKDPQTGRAYRYHWDPGPFGKVLTPLPTSGLIDFTNPEAYAFWRDRHEALIRQGVDVMKTDFGEQIPDGVVAHNGDTGDRLHNVYPLIYNRCVFEAYEKFRPEEPALVWGRSAWAGSQRYPVQWGGDPQNDWEGLAGSLRGGLSWGLSGVPGFATDIGGFYGGQPDAELFVRWTQAAVFSSHIRFHGIGPREPWAFGREAEDICRSWLEFRYQLIPYTQGLLEEAAETGLPVQRPMVLAFPDDPASWAFDTQFMYGPSLLVAPVLRPGGTVTVYFPAGRWFDVWTGEHHEGGRAVTVTVPLDRLPVFGREGTVLPLGPSGQSIKDVEGKPLAALWSFGVPRSLPRLPGAPLSLAAKGGSAVLSGLPGDARLMEFGARAVRDGGTVTIRER